MESREASEWLGACRRIAAGVEAMLAGHPTTRERAVETGRGEGGDESLVIDRAAEDLALSELETLHADGLEFTVVSEERGRLDFGSQDRLVVIDPIDGSLNAKRGLAAHAISIAVAEGTTMADVSFAFVHDLGCGEQWTAERGRGAQLHGTTVSVSPETERRRPDGRLEVVAIESASPRWVEASAPALREAVYRVRALGSIALALCQVAAGRVDGMVTLWRCRAVDAAAAQLIVRESGGLVAFTSFADPLAAPLDLEPHSPVVAALSEGGLQELARVPAQSGA